MAKKVKVQLFGLQNRGIDVNIDATEGATLGKDLYWPDGSLVTQETIINQTIITTPDGPVGVVPTLWELILNIPANIVNLASLATFGFISRIDGSGNMVSRSIVGEEGRIKTLNGDGVAGDPQISLGEWPTVLPSVPESRIANVPANHQLIVSDDFELIGDLEIFPGGELLILGEPPIDPFNPDFTYGGGGELTQIDYENGEQKVFSYNGGGQLTQLDYIADGTTLRKLFFYTGGGDLDYITQSYL